MFLIMTEVIPKMACKLINLCEDDLLHRVGSWSLSLQPYKTNHPQVILNRLTSSIKIWKVGFRGVQGFSTTSIQPPDRIANRISIPCLPNSHTLATSPIRSVEGKCRGWVGWRNAYKELLQHHSGLLTNNHQTNFWEFRGVTSLACGSTTNCKDSCHLTELNINYWNHKISEFLADRNDLLADLLIS